MNLQKAHNQYLINQAIIDLVHKYTSDRRFISLARNTFLLVPVYPMYKNKNALRETEYFSIRSVESITDKKDAADFVNKLFEILETDFHPKTEEYKKISNEKDDVYEYAGAKIIIPKCKSEKYKKYMTEDEIFQRYLYFSYIDKFFHMYTTLDLELTEQIINLFGKKNNIEIVTNFLWSSMALLDHDNFYIKTMYPATDQKINYLGHAYSDKFLDNSFVIARLLIYFPMEYLFYEEVIPKALKKYQNITFLCFIPSHNINFITKIYDPKYIKYNNKHTFKYFTYDCSVVKVQHILNDILIISNDKNVPDISKLLINNE